MHWLAIKALLADRSKLLTSLLGLAFAVVLINLQGGLLIGLIRKASLLVDFGQADIWVGHKHMNNVDIGTFIPERWVYRIRAIEGVERAEPYVVMFGQATMPDGKFENVIVVGSEPASLLGNAWTTEKSDATSIRHPDGILVDVEDRHKLGYCKIGDRLEINGKRARVVGMTKGIVGFTTNPYVFTTLERARSKYANGVPPAHCSYFLVKAAPGVHVDALCERIRKRLPEVEVYDRRTYSLLSMKFWLTRTGIGLSFGLAAVLGLLVGLAVVAQTLYASVTERIKEFATLKAIGTPDRGIGRFLIAQFWVIAILGAGLGLSSAFALGQILATPRVPVVWSPWVAALSVSLTWVVCLASCWLPYWRIRRLDPAIVLRS
jgi:putative ABC transport system permease protein